MHGNHQGISLTQAIDLIRKLHQSNHVDDALELCEKVVDLWAESPDAWHFLGLIRYHRDEDRAGISAVRRALELAPDYADAHANLGNMLLNQGSITEAQHHLHRALLLNPQAFPPRIALGAVYRALNRLDEAEAVLKPALETHSDSGLVHNAYGSLLAARGRDAEAITHFQRAVELNPEIAGTHQRLGLMLAYAGRIDDAQQVFRRQLEQNPNDPHAQHLMAALGGAEVPERASDRYVRGLFDGFAASFDAKLANLDYRAPELVANLAHQVLGPARGCLDALDLGCGTGLLGPLVRAHCRRLEGVDLSPGMLARARKRKVYDALYDAELTAHLRQRVGAQDLLTCADTLCYFGALEDFLSAAHAALRLGGWLLFTVECGSEQAAPYHLQFHGRYAHRRDYVEASVRAAGFDQVQVLEDTLRMEALKPVFGLIVAVQRGS